MADDERPGTTLDDPEVTMNDDPKPRRALSDEETAGPDIVGSAGGPAESGDGSSLDQETTTTGRAARRRRRWKAFAWIVGILGLVIALVIGVAAVRATMALNNIERGQDFLPEETTRPVEVKGPLAFVLLGTDASDLPERQEGARSDSLMVAYVPANREHVYLVSIPRDLWVPVDGVGYAKINAAYDEDGVRGSVRAVEKLFDVRMNHVGVVDFAGFLKLMDVLGGVDVINPVASTSGIDDDGNPIYIYPEGPIHLEGDAGLAFVRQRHELPNGDLDRTARQRAVIQAIIAKALSKGVLTNPAVMNDFLTKVTDVVTVDAKLTNTEIIGIATGMKIHSSSDIRTLMLPIAGYDTSDDGQAIDVPDEDAIAELGNAMRTDTMDAWWDENKDDPLITDNRAWPIGQAPGAGTTPEPTTPSATPTGHPTRAVTGPTTRPGRTQPSIPPHTYGMPVQPTSQPS